MFPWTLFGRKKDWIMSKKNWIMHFVILERKN